MVPLSWAQQRIWFLAQLDAAAAQAYHIAAGVRLRGPLRHDAFTTALDRLVARHEALRTTFPQRAGQPIQEVAAAGRFALQVQDLRTVPAGERETRLRQMMQTEASRPFDLALGPLARGLLVQLDEQEHEWVLVQHHIVSDGESLALLTGELAELYAAFVDGHPDPIPLPSVQYGDFAAWQQQPPQEQRLAAQLSRWRERLSGAPHTVDLPCDRPRPPLQTYRGLHHRFHLPPSLVPRLKALGTASNATPFMVFGAAFAALLHRYAGQRDVCIGFPISQRQRPGLERAVGLFVNTLVLRAECPGNLPFRALLDQVRSRAVEAYANQDLPFERLVQAVAPARDLGRSPLFQVMLDLDVAGVERFAMGAVEATIDEDFANSVKCDLQLKVRLLSGDRIECRWAGNRDLFEPATLQRLARSLVDLLEEVSERPETPLHSLLCRPPSSAQDSSAPRPVAPGCDVLSRIAACVAATPQREAVAAADRTFTYAQLWAAAGRVAAALRQAGAGAGAWVAVVMERGADLLAAQLGVMRAGAAFVPVDPHSGDAAVARALNQSAAPLAALVSRTGTKLPVLARLPRLNIDALPRAPIAHALPSVVPPGQPAYGIFTSGSTGVPKLVGVAHGQLSAYVDSSVGALGVHAGLRFAMVSSVAADLGFTALFPTLCTGGCVCIPTRDDVTDPLGFVAAMKRLRVNAIKIVPGHWDAMLDHPAISTDGWSPELIVFGGEALRATTVRDVRRRFPGARVFNHYGPTETTVGVVVSEITGAPAEEVPPPIGRPLPHVRAYVLDERQRFVPEGAVGELYIGGASVADGYIGQPLLTAECFLPDPYGGWPGARMYRTGDRVRHGPSGELQFIGRADRQVKVAGYRVELGELEALIGRVECVREVAVLAHTEGHAVALHAVVASDEAALTPESLRERLRQVLPAPLVPARLAVCRLLPRGINGKVDAAALLATAAPHSEDRPDDRTELVDDEVQATLAEIWREVLGLPQVSADADFFALGGTSLQVIQVVARVQGRLSRSLPVREFMRASGLRELAEAVRRLPPQQDEPVLRPLPRQPGDNRFPTSYGQQRIWFFDLMDPGTIIYNEPTVMRVIGRLDLDSFRRALDDLVERHEILRTRFELAQGLPVQVVARKLSVPVEVHTLQQVSGEERDAAIRRFAQVQHSLPFELDRLPLLRVCLLRVNEAEHVLVAVGHHIVSDAWSGKVLVSDLLAFYEARRAGRIAQLPPLAVQYGDVAAWQREMAQSLRFREALAFWHDTLRHAPPNTTLPSSRPRPAVQSFRGTSLRARLEPGQRQTLAALASASGVTLYALLMGALALLLRQRLQRDDLVIGMPSAARERVEFEPLIGFFVNSLAVRLQLDGAGTFRGAVRHVHQRVSAAYGHQVVPFDQVVRDVLPSRDPRYHPLFQVFFVMNDDPAETLEVPGVSFEPMWLDDRTAKFDLEVLLVRRGDAIDVAFNYCVDLFDEHEVRELLDDYLDGLAAWVADPDAMLQPLLPAPAPLALPSFDFE
ncbi:non-ribosomal peptide synthetase [Rubrivivax gelatinosus]|uniref:non-ribosomal peptide synthetase n=1 Tax=Rubrivivax gelatinosus TaxID=28068 RepID=UPI001ED8D2ED|nr:non-ribosomal peptide synthetase [Rubrivivax gelatinosus]